MIGSLGQMGLLCEVLRDPVLSLFLLLQSHDKEKLLSSSSAHGGKMVVASPGLMSVVQAGGRKEGRRVVCVSEEKYPRSPQIHLLCLIGQT